MSSRKFRNGGSVRAGNSPFPFGNRLIGDVIGDFNSRRGQIQSMEASNGGQEILAYVPLSEMFGYATDLRSKTQGRGLYSMEPSHFAEVPKSIQEEIIKSR